MRIQANDKTAVLQSYPTMLDLGQDEALFKACEWLTISLPLKLIVTHSKQLLDSVLLA